MPDLKSICTCFPGGKHKALTMSFDDGRTEDRQLVKMFNQYGVKGTFNVNSGLHTKDRIELNECATLYRGHEIACHTVTHPSISLSPLDQVAQQVLEDRRALEAMVGHPVRGLAYPNGSYNDRITKLLPALGICYARTVKGTQSFDMPQDFLEWNPTCHFKENLLELGEQFVSLKKTNRLYLMYVWGHSFELPEHDGWALMDSFCKLAGGKTDTWYATNIEIVDYMEAASRLQFTADGGRVYNPNALPCWVKVAQNAIEIPAGRMVQLD